MKLKGECHLCGICCGDGKGAWCSNLEIITLPGVAFSTRCKVYESRYDRMPIRMVRKDGSEIKGPWVCHKGTPEEEETIIKNGIGRGCSLVIK